MQTFLYDFLVYLLHFNKLVSIQESTFLSVKQEMVPVQIKNVVYLLQVNTTCMIRKRNCLTFNHGRQQCICNKVIKAEFFFVWSHSSQLVLLLYLFSQTDIRRKINTFNHLFRLSLRDPMQMWPCLMPSMHHVGHEWVSVPHHHHLSAHTHIKFFKKLRHNSNNNHHK